ncbi:hypothetical protein AWM75_07250 [Aerococcus urinaehominis]|uniref:DNA-directed RNA polymerase subunit epsilon n=1 Tax=Aerococcus urinaehominis TaxID=128944 RepID=A0A109RHF1_9LACT|nr:DNA-directed RNA polymerase subunit epsilon [Aerococcus urinaehominis]AMB99771.1 hypothetical protein AWM75_07250 [Aerococcus urinaehominis]SDM09623.1 DNA-dependent RNA polymerase auxiliary subunit epsilon [Aerococcus urinaehominis]
MIFKVTYQESKVEVPRREATQTLYMEAESEREVRQAIEQNTPYNVEYIQILEGDHLAYEQSREYYQLTEFDN